MARWEWVTAGESHGPALVATLSGVPANLVIGSEDIDRALIRRQQGYGRGGRMKIETDHATILSGVRGGRTLGSPIALMIENRDHANWVGRMGAEPFTKEPEAVTRPRPGHADLAGGQKYGLRDLRDVLERASARETAARVAVGAIAQAFLKELGIAFRSGVRSIGPIEAASFDPSDPSFEAAVAESSLGCPDRTVEEAMRQAIHQASHEGDTLGGVFEVWAFGVPPGLGSYAAWASRLDGRLAQALMSIPAIKGVEIGLGMRAALERGSAVHDPIAWDGTRRRFERPQNHAGGIEGGVSNGMPIVVRAAMKPISTLRRGLPSVELRSRQPEVSAFERSDVCAVPAACVVGEMMVALTLADAVGEKFGGDSMAEVRRNLAGYLASLETWATDGDPG